MNNRYIKIAISIYVCIFCSGYEIHAQTFEEYKHRVQSEFKQYKAERTKKYKEYRDRINAEFAEYMRQAWKEYKSEPAIPVPDSPEPPAPVVKDPNTQPSNDSVSFDSVVPAPAPVVQPKPIVPLPELEIPEKPEPVAPQPKPEPETPEKPVPAKPAFTFTFYGQDCSAPLEDKHRFTLQGIDENRVADAWTRLSSDDYLPVVAACLEYRSRLHLCDWGYVRFVEQLASAFFPADRLNEARLLQMYILTHSGYKVRIARAGDKLALLLPSKETIYEYPFLTIDGCRYYIVDSSLKEASFKVYNRKFPNEQFFLLQISEEPLLPVRAAASRRLQLRCDNLAADISVNKNLIDFYDNYPLSNNWDIYSKASLSEYAKKQLYPVLRQAIDGKDKTTAANTLLHFVQTAFKYRTDAKQFGRERALFADETLFYPYSDCEDRAILYSILVRELLELDVVLVHYPGHLAAAVHFDEAISGDYLNIDGKRYTICDPTYINADIGESMPQYKQAKVKVLKTQ